MDYVKLGRTGLDVSRICLGCMTFGVPDRGMHQWTLDDAASRPIIKRALDLGINFFDTANAYSDGTSEEIVGRALADFGRRDEIVLATKVFYPLRQAPNVGGLSRKAIFTALDASLRRLGTDYVDLYQIHRWDYGTPIEESLEALHDVVKAGKVRYLGASSMFAWQFSKSLYVSRARGWTPFATMQNHYNLLYREEEREMLPLCASEGIGVIPWSPLARGRLTRDAGETTERVRTDAYGKSLYDSQETSDRQVIDAVSALAARRALPRAQVALAWLLHQPIVTAPIVGASKVAQLEDAVAAVSVTLSPDEIAALEQPYVPHPVAGFE